MQYGGDVGIFHGVRCVDFDDDDDDDDDDDGDDDELYTMMKMNCVLICKICNKSERFSSYPIQCVVLYSI